MEKKPKTSRGRTGKVPLPISPSVPQESSQTAPPPATGEAPLGALSALADSARKRIMTAPESDGETASSAQADLLKSRNRVEEVRKRIQTGYYGRPDIIGRIIDKLADDLRP